MISKYHKKLIISILLILLIFLPISYVGYWVLKKHIIDMASPELKIYLKEAGYLENLENYKKSDIHLALENIELSRKHFVKLKLEVYYKEERTYNFYIIWNIRQWSKTYVGFRLVQFVY